jgi:hypothetical protein
MKRARLLSLLVVALLWSCLADVSAAGTLVWHADRASAVQAARLEGKRILLVAGRHTCGNCNYMRNTVCELADPPVRALLAAEYVTWFCDVDASTEWRAYTAGLCGFTLPLICRLDADAPTQFLDRTTGIQPGAAFYPRLLAPVQQPVRAPRFVELQVTEGAVRLTVTNLTFGLTHQFERTTVLGGGGAWTPVGSFTAWSRGTNWVGAGALGSGGFYRLSVRAP